MDKKNSMRPESLMMTHAYEPFWSEGAIKAPLFQTSTFGFRCAEDGKAFFEVAYGLRERGEMEDTGLIYSRLNNPNLEILENRLCLWDNAEGCAVFQSGMSAISTVMMEFLQPGQVILYSSPTYGGTDHFINHYLPKIGIESMGFTPWQTKEEIIEMIDAAGIGDRIGLIYIETPANPTNAVIDIAMCREIADRYAKDEHRAYVAVDNTYMGPIWCSPIEHGADIVLYSATKYIGGHSDLIAGAALGSAEVIQRLKVLRTFFGNMPSPHTCWLMMRSLETLKVRMEQQAANAQKVAEYLSTHELVDRVHYMGLIPEGTREHEIYTRQYTSPGAMISFEVRGGETEAFAFLNSLKLIKLAVSLGSTESLAEHPHTMTHISVDPELKARIGINEKLVRLSIGVEHYEDLIQDIAQALEVMAHETAIDLKEG